jgi:hypothetical protein
MSRVGTGAAGVVFQDVHFNHVGHVCSSTVGAEKPLFGLGGTLARDLKETGGQGCTTFYSEMQLSRSGGSF